MEILEDTKGAVRILKPRGPLAGTDAEGFMSRAREVLQSSLGRVVVDVSAVPFADSRGLEVLAELAEEMSQSGQTLRLCAVGETLREVFDLTELAGGFEVFDDVTGAVRSFL